MENSGRGNFRHRRHRLATTDELNRICRNHKREVKRQRKESRQNEEEEGDDNHNIGRLTKVYLKTVWKETKSRICHWFGYRPMVADIRGAEKWEVKCAKVQQEFDGEVDVIIRKMLEANFETIITDHINSPLRSSICPEDLVNRIACRLLEDSTERYRKLIPMIKANKYHVQEPPFRGEIVYNRIDGIYRYFPDLDEPPDEPKKKPSSINIVSKQLSIREMGDKGKLRKTKKKRKETLQQKGKESSDTELEIEPEGIEYNKIETNPQRQEVTMLQNEREKQLKIFWNMDLIESSTKFVLESEASKALGLPKTGKKRLSHRHLELIRYKVDNKDRQWLLENKIIEKIVNKKPRRIMLFMLHQIEKLQKDNECYRDCNLSEMTSFTLPQFILRKIQLYIIRVQIRSNGCITTVEPKPIPINDEVSIQGNELMELKPSCSSRLNTRPIYREHPGIRIQTADASKSNTQNSSHLIFGALLNNPLAMSRHSYSRLYLPTINRVHTLR